MGYNTVAVLLNDQHHRWPKEMQDAERNLRVPPQHHPQTHFGYGEAISCEHADITQVVFVKCNGGERIQDAGPDAQALWLIEKWLDKQGLRITKKRKPKEASK